MRLAAQSIIVALLALVLVGFGKGLYYPRGRALWHQYQSESFSKTEGTIVSGRVDAIKRSKGGPSYHPNFTYTYEVEGQKYAAQIYRYNRYPMSWAETKRVVEAHPAGSMMVVYYNPKDPADALLSPGIVAQDVSPMFFFTAGLMTALWILWQCWQIAQRLGGAARVAGGVKILSRGFVTRVRLPRFTPLGMALAAAGIGCIAMGLLSLFAFMATPVAAGVAGAIAVSVAAVTTFSWQFWKIASGSQDLVIDEDARTVRLPMTYRRREQRPMALSQIKSVTLRKIRRQSRNGTYYTYAPTLQMQDGTSQQLADWPRHRAESFRGWLGEKLGVPSRGAENDA